MNQTVRTILHYHTTDLLQLAIDKSGTPPIWQTVIAEAERALVTSALEFHRGNKLRAARALGITRNTLYRKMRDIEVQP